MKSCLFILLSILSIGFSEKGAKNRPNFGNTCSRGCFCESVYSVRCQNGGLDDVPNDLSPALTRLDLQRNRLFQVSSIINSYGKLQFLRLNQNNIGSLNSKNFDRLNELVDLEIADNKLSGLPDETFAGLFKLRNLDLSNNQIESLSARLFRSSPNLQVLDLSHNKLDDLPRNLFENTALQELNLKNNFFKEIPSDAFTFTPHLSILNFEGNDISSLSGSPFKNLKKLTTLNLNGCQITNLNQYSVDGLDSLRQLNIGQNKISQFPTDAFRNLEHLEELEIGLNYITELNSKGLTNLKNLKHFSMTGCKMELTIKPDTFRDNSELESINITRCTDLTELSPNTFTSLPFLKSLNFHQSGLTQIHEEAADWSNLIFMDFSNNPLDCSCELQWLKPFYDSNAKCHSPSKFSGEFVHEIQDSFCDFDGLSWWVILLIVLGVVLAICILTYVIYYFTNRGTKRPKLKRPKSLNSKADIVVMTYTPESSEKYLDIENIYEDPAEVPLGSAQNYPDVKTTVL